MIPCHHEGAMRKENACKCIRLPESFKGDDVVRRQVVGFADL